MRWQVSHDKDDWSDPVEVDAASASDAVREAADTFYSSRDGWEWMTKGDTEFFARAGASAPVRCVVTLEFEPTFCV